MSEGNHNGQRENPELTDLIRELESQIESVNAGLSKIRGTVARISFAALGSTTPAPSSSWGVGIADAPPPRQEWQPAASAESSPVEPVVSSPSPTFDADTRPPVAHPEPVHEPVGIWDSVAEAEPAGFWDSVAEGASWPRAHTNDDESVHEVAPKTSAWLAGSDAFEVRPKHESISRTAFEPAAGPEEAATAADEPVSAIVLPGAQTEAPVPGVPESVRAETAPETVDEWAVEAPAEKQQDTPAETPAEGMPSTLSSGWPDESAWSQNFEWPAMKRDAEEPAVADQAATEDARAAVSDIVAQMKAELAGGSLEGVEPSDDFDSGQDGAAPAITDAVQGVADDARRDEVSRAVAAMREQLEAGDFESVMRGNGYHKDAPALETANEAAPAEAATVEVAGGEQVSEEDVRAEVRRAVEATREELSTARPEPTRAEKPAFRLAAPGSIPDWSHVQMEPSGPPVVVMKDADGRVELASVYETLHELGCGDGAALLNYTPHSVTVGLPIAAQFPSKERVAEAVEKVFGLTSSVESDGVRITVSIGVNPKQRSVDAA